MHTNLFNSSLNIPEGFIVFISGVPGVGKTTLSYELLRRFSQFRLIQETDLIREILRGYNDYVKTEAGDKRNINLVEIYDNTKFLNYEEASIQCKYMKYSLIEIIRRQRRRGISTIINGVHIIPEVLEDLAYYNNVVFINLFISDKDKFVNRFDNRCKEKYSIHNIEYIFNTNHELHQKTIRLNNKYNAFFSFDISLLSISQTVDKIIKCITKKIDSSY